MVKTPLTNWGAASRESFTYLGKTSCTLKVFLDADGLAEEQVLPLLPYSGQRSPKISCGPDPKRYRDPRLVFTQLGLLCDDSGCLKLTEFGVAVKRWIPIITEANAPVFGRHIAHALSACQLRNPTGAGKKYDLSMQVFHCSFIWSAMLELDNKIASEEVNCAILKVRNRDELSKAIEAIGQARKAGSLDMLGEPVESSGKANDRIIPWMALASFGWTLFDQKRDGYYTIPERNIEILRNAANFDHQHRDFSTESEYAQHIANAAQLPKDVR